MKSMMRITLALMAFALSALAQDLQPNGRAQGHGSMRGDVLGSMNSKRQTLKRGLSTRREQYNYTQVDVPGSTFTGLTAINSSRQTVGWYADAGGTTHGFLRNVDGSVVTIDYPGAILTGANGINSQGDVVGRWDDAGGINHSFLRTSLGTITSFDPSPPCVPTTEPNPAAAHGINDRGDIVGRCFDASGKELGWLLRQDGSFTIIDNPAFLSTDAWAIDDTRVVAGDYSDGEGLVHGYKWSEADGFTTVDFETDQTGLRAINQRGDVSGIYWDGFTFHGFLRLKNGTEITVDPLGSIETDTAVVNDGGTIAGIYWDADFNQHGYLAVPLPRAVP